MTEIPEHLLARSRARREAIGQAEGDAPADRRAGRDGCRREGLGGRARHGGRACRSSVRRPRQGTGRTGACRRRSRSVPRSSRPSRARRSRGGRCPPSWRCRLWAVIYAFTLEPNEEQSAAIALGQEVYESNGCAGCHGPEGAGQGDGVPRVHRRRGRPDLPGLQRPGGLDPVGLHRRRARSRRWLRRSQPPRRPAQHQHLQRADAGVPRPVRRGGHGRDPLRARGARRGALRARAGRPRPARNAPGSATRVHERRPRAARGPGRRGRSRRGGGGVLAGEGRSRRRLRRAEVLSPREDLRRRPDPACRAPAPGDGPRAGHRGRRAPPLRRPAGLRPRHHPRAGVARAPGLPVVRLRRAPARPRPARGRRRGRLPAPPCTRAPRPSHRSSRAGSYVVRS